MSSAWKKIGEMSLASVHVLLIFATRYNLMVKQIAHVAGPAQAGASRILDSLGYRSRRGEPDLGFVCGHMSPSVPFQSGLCCGYGKVPSLCSRRAKASLCMRWVRQSLVKTLEINVMKKPRYLSLISV